VSVCVCMCMCVNVSVCVCESVCGCDVCLKIQCFKSKAEREFALSDDNIGG